LLKKYAFLGIRSPLGKALEISSPLNPKMEV